MRQAWPTLSVLEQYQRRGKCSDTIIESAVIARDTKDRSRDVEVSVTHFVLCARFIARGITRRTRRLFIKRIMGNARFSVIPVFPPGEA